MNQIEIQREPDIEAPRQEAYWELVRYDPDYLVWSAKCTNCNERHESSENVGKLPFCPHCGSKMHGEKVPRLIEVDP